MLVACHVFATGSYLPPVLRLLVPSYPPQAIILLPVHTAVCLNLPLGAPVVLVASHVSATGSYLPPVLVGPVLLDPPQTIILVPVQTAV